MSEYKSVKKERVKAKKRKEKRTPPPTADWRQNPVTGEIEHLDEGGRKIRDPLRNPVVIKTMTHDIMNEVLKKTEEGEMITEICTALSIRTNSVYSLLARNEKFKLDFDRARSVAAYKFEDKIEELAENTNHEDDVPVSNFKLKAYDRLAQIKNPDRYGKTRTEGGNNDGKSINITFNTGIDRTKKIKDAPLISVVDKKK